VFETEQEAKNSAIQLLSRREHSRKELNDKLGGRSQNVDLEKVLDDLESNGYLSDHRFTESFIRMRISQGHGLIRIQFDLRRKGVGSELIAQILEEMDIDWYQQAVELYRRKYRTAIEEKDYKERSKRLRYMSQRGFSSEQCQYAMSPDSTLD